MSGEESEIPVNTGELTQINQSGNEHFSVMHTNQREESNLGRRANMIRQLFKGLQDDEFPDAFWYDAYSEKGGQYFCILNNDTSKLNVLELVCTKGSKIEDDKIALKFRNLLRNFRFYEIGLLRGFFNLNENESKWMFFKCQCPFHSKSTEKEIQEVIALQTEKRKMQTKKRKAEIEMQKVIAPAAAAAAAVDPPQSANVTQAQLAVAAALPLATPEVDEWVACDANCKNGCGDGPAEPGEWFICREVGLRSAPEGYWRCPTCNGDVAAEKRKMQKVIKNPKVPTYSRIKDTTDSKGVNGNSESKSVTSVYKAQGQPWSSLFKVPKP